MNQAGRPRVHIFVTAVRLSILLLLPAVSLFPSPTLTPEATRAFDRYVDSAEAAMTQDAPHFPDIVKLRTGEVRIDSGSPPQNIYVPGAMSPGWGGVLLFSPRC